ncbi:MAG: flagellar motor switch protein FliY [Arcobacter sp.]|nr:MAG: flagellar motor switch protein FliY [Arcobacter sp.]
MASDISNIIRNEISTTLESLLSVGSSVEEVVLVSSSDIEDCECINIAVSFDLGGKESQWSYFIPTSAATQFEYLMLGGVTDLKDAIDDEIIDAVKEIISTISGSICTSVNAQGFADISGIKSNMGDSSVVSLPNPNSKSSMYKFVVKLNDEYIDMYISFDADSIPFVELLTNDLKGTASSTEMSNSGQSSIITSLLGEESVDNLRLLFDIKMRLSVRLGTKICLLRDVISWDIGEIIELSQMTSEPLDILVNGVVIGTGEAIIVDGKFGVKIKHIGKIK